MVSLWPLLIANELGFTGDLDKINPNLKRFQIINHRQNYFTRLTPFCIAIHGDDAEGGATPLPVAR
jgi:hypothetical protein